MGRRSEREIGRSEKEKEGDREGERGREREEGEELHTYEPPTLVYRARSVSPASVFEQALIMWVGWGERRV